MRRVMTLWNIVLLTTIVAITAIVVKVKFVGKTTKCRIKDYNNSRKFMIKNLFHTLFK